MSFVTAFGAGIFYSAAHFNFEQIIAVSIIGLIAIVLMALALLVFKLIKRSIPKLTRCAVLSIFCIVFFCFGMFYVNIYSQASKEDARNYMNEWVQLSGTVVMPPKLSSNKKNTQYIVQADSIEIRKTKETIKVKGKVIIHTPVAENTLAYGDGISCYVKLQPPMQAENKGDFDYSLYLKQQDVHISCYSRTVTQIPTPQSFNPHSISAVGVGVRNHITASIDKYVGDIFTSRYKKDISALLKGVMVGDKADFSPELYDNFSKTGISHIVAVSGMHITILFTVLVFLLNKIRVKKLFVHIIMLFVLLLFMSVALYTPSVMRASIMMIIFLLSYMFKRDHDPLTSLFIAGGVMLCMNPYTIFSVGFILSFVSTLCLIVFTPLISPTLKIIDKIPKVGRYIREGLAVSLSTAVGTVYFVAVFFNIFSLAPFLINLFVIPFMTLVFSSGYLIWVLDIVRLGFLAKGLAYVISLPLLFIIELANFFAHIPFIWWNVPSPKEWMFYVYLALCVTLYFFLKFLQKRDEIYG